MRFSEDFIEQVKDRNEILDVIGPHVNLQKAGTSFRGLCPFLGHSEKTPSFFVSQSKQLYHCFGCKKSGTIYNFLMDFQGLSFVDAVENLAQRAGIPLPEKEKTPNPAVGKLKEERALLLKLNRYVGAIFRRNFQSKPTQHPLRLYVAQRGLTDEIISEFKLGYAEHGWNTLVDSLKSGKVPLGVAETGGLIKKKSDGSFFDVFRDRLIFPILSVTGDVLGFGGRVLTNQQPKYLNSPETPLFHKGKTLYGLHISAKHIRAQDEVYVVEGYMDLLSLYQFGIKNVVATLGTALTADHCRLIKHLTSRVIVLFDGDEAGQMAANKSLPIFLEAGLMPRCLTLPEGLDPDDFIRKYGSTEFLKQAKAAPDHFISFMNRQMQNYGGRPSEKVQLLDTVGPILERVRDQRLRILYLQELADRLGVSPKTINLRPSKSTQITEITDEINLVAKKEKTPPEESILVRFMLQKPSYLEEIRSSGAIDKFMNREASVAAKLIVEKYCQNPNDFDKLASSLIVANQIRDQKQQLSSDTLRLLTEPFAGEVIGQGDEASEKQLLQDCIRKVMERDLQVKSRALLNSIKAESIISDEKLKAFLKLAQEKKKARGN